MSKISFLLIIPVLVMSASLAALADADSDALALFEPYGAGASRSASRAADSPRHKWPDLSMAILNAARNWDRFKPETRAALSKYIDVSDIADGRRSVRSAAEFSACIIEITDAGPISEKTSAHFRALYTQVPSSPHKATETYISGLLQAADAIWEKEVSGMGFPAPLPTSDEDNKLWLVVCNLVDNSGDLGTTWPFEMDTINRRARTWIELDNDYADLTTGSTIEYAGNVLAHEFFHSIQFGINYEAPSLWLAESNATWIEEEVYPQENDYLGYAVDTFAQIGVPIDTNSGMLVYGASIFFRHITENEADTDFIRRLWAALKSACANSNSAWCNGDVTEIPLVDAMLKNYGSDISTAYENFNIANYAKDYIDGDNPGFPDIPTSPLSAAPGTVSSGASLDRLSAKFYKIDCSTVNALSNIKLTFTGAANTEWRISRLSQKVNGELLKERLPTTSSQAGASYSAPLLCMKEIDDNIVLIINNASASANGKSYSVRLDTETYQEASGSVSLQKGWNILGLPFEQLQYNPPLNGTGLRDNDLVGVSGSKYLEADFNAVPVVPGSAYWTYLDAPKTVYLSGGAAKTKKTPLKQGWNFFSLPYASPAAWDSSVMVEINSITYSVTSVFAPTVISQKIYAYNTAEGRFDPGYGPTDNFTMEPLKGYAIYANMDCLLVFP